MCVVSMVINHHQSIFPDYQQFPPAQYPDYLELVRKAKLYDEMMKQKDCPDPEKEAWQKNLEKFMADQYGLHPKSAP